MKNTLFKTSFCLAVLIAVGRSAAACPTDMVRPFVGRWQGSAVLTTANGAALTSGTLDVITLRDCETFEVDVSYLDASGAVARNLHFFAVQQPSGPLGAFDVVQGTIAEGLNKTSLTGTIEASTDGRLLGHFSGSVGGRSAFLSEVMNLNGANSLVRTVQMSAVQMGGNEIGTRVVHDTRIE